MWGGIEAGERCPSKQCVIATAERDNVENQVFASEVIWWAEMTSSVMDPVQQASTPGITPLKVVLVGLILDGSMPILRTGDTSLMYL